MTWNLRLGIQEGLEPIARRVRRESPDLLAIQEVGRHWVMGPEGDTTAQLAEMCGFEHSVFVPSLSWYPPAQYGHALLSRHRLVQPRVLRLPRTRDERRTAVVTTTNVRGRVLTVVGTHLSHVEDRPRQGATLVETLRALDDAGDDFVLLGDLNEEDASTAWMSELARFASPAPADAPTFPADSPKLRIDWIWANFGSWRAANVVKTERASDHLPVVATLSF